ncbi:MAG TPA: YaiO family outer membrane beta-barrel protein [Longimicrobiales bacterium]
MKRSGHLIASAAALLLMPLSVQSQTSVEITTGNSTASGGFGTYNSLGVRLRHQRPADVWYVGVSHESAWGDDGWLGNIANVHTFNPRWSSYLSATTSTDAFFLPRYRFDAELSRRLGGPRAWVLTGSAMTRAARDEHHDIGGGIGVGRFLRRDLAADVSVFWTHTAPEDVVSRYQHLGLTWYRPQRELGARVSFGEESYLPVTADSTLVAFNSYAVTVRWVERIDNAVAISLHATYYENPRYRSRGFGATVVRRIGR